MPFWKPLIKKPEINAKANLKNHTETFSSISDMIDIQNKLISVKKNLEINLKNCSTLSTTNTMLLASISLMRKNNNKNTILSFDGNSKLMDDLTEINFISGKKNKNFNMEPKPFKTEEEIQTILKEIKSSSKYAIINNDERNILISKTYELLINAWEHGENSIGAICHCFYKNKKFNFSVYDFGIGIPEKVRNYLKNSDMSDIDTIKWALSDGNSTRLTSDSPFPGGSGLKLIEKFLKEYKGKLIICSGNAYYTIKGDKIQSRTMSHKISGTLITLTVPI